MLVSVDLGGSLSGKHALVSWTSAEAFFEEAIKKQTAIKLLPGVILAAAPEQLFAEADCIIRFACKLVHTEVHSRPRLMHSGEDNTDHRLTCFHRCPV